MEDVCRVGTGKERVKMGIVAGRAEPRRKDWRADAVDG
jgi:hypothetical protein